MNLSLKRKEIFIFDWDGTIFDSMKIKLETFSSVLSQMLGEYTKDSDLASKVKCKYERLSGLPRKEIIQNILEEFEIQKDLIDYAEFNHRLMAENKRYLEAASVFPDAQSLLATLIKKRKVLFISSSVPQNELSYFIKRKLEASLIDGISNVLGSGSNGFCKGEGHFGFIKNMTGASKDKMLFIGDDLADYQLGKSAGVDVLLIDRENKHHRPEIGIIRSLSVLGDKV